MIYGTFDFYNAPPPVATSSIGVWSRTATTTRTSTITWMACRRASTTVTGAATVTLMTEPNATRSSARGSEYSLATATVSRIASLEVRLWVRAFDDSMRIWATMLDRLRELDAKYAGQRGSGERTEVFLRRVVAEGRFVGLGRPIAETLLEALDRIELLESKNTRVEFLERRVEYLEELLATRGLQGEEAES